MACAWVAVGESGPGVISGRDVAGLGVVGERGYGGYCPFRGGCLRCLSSDTGLSRYRGDREG